MALLLAALAACGATGSPPPEAAASSAVHADTLPAAAWTDQDWAILAAKVRWGAERGLAQAPVGEAIVRLGETFVGTTYRPGTLEVPGSERVVVNLRELDCVTFIETVLALVRFIREDGTALLADTARARARYEGYLRDVRYRGGVLDGYPSRLHYFSEWLADNEARGRLRLVTRELGGVPDAEPLGFMTAHPGAYRQLADSAVREAVGATEARLNAGPGRWYLPQDRIAGAVGGIRDGDLIAATSTLPGLDVAHTGIALWREGRLHLLHAPLVGSSVEVSARPLAERIRGIASQDGIMVARVIAP